MTANKAFAIAFVVIVSLFMLAAANLGGAWLVSYGGTLGMALMPLVVLFDAWLLYRLWVYTINKLFPTKKESK